MTHPLLDEALESTGAGCRSFNCMRTGLTAKLPTQPPSRQQALNEEIDTEVILPLRATRIQRAEREGQ